MLAVGGGELGVAQAVQILESDECRPDEFVGEDRPEDHPEEVEALVEHDASAGHLAGHLLHQGLKHSLDGLEQRLWILASAARRREQLKEHEVGLVAKEPGLAVRLAGRHVEARVPQA